MPGDLMKVMVVAETMAPGGMEGLLARLLPLLQQRGLDVGLAVMKTDMPLALDLPDQGVPVWNMGHVGSSCRVKLHRRALRRAIGRLHELVLRERPDLILGAGYYPDAVVYLPAHPGRVILGLHGEPPWWGRRWEPRMVAHTLALRRRARNRSYRFIAISGSVRDAALEMYAVPPPCIRVIHNGIDTSRFTPLARGETGSGGAAGPVIVQVGNLYPHKGHTTSLRALGRIRRTCPEARLLLAGEGPARQDLERLRDELGLGPAVEFLGWRDDVRGLLQGADVYWMPSLREGFGLACVEAMACGLPPVVSSAGGLPEVVEDGVSGMVVPPLADDRLAEATLKLWNGRDLAARMGHAARLRAEQKFSHTVMVDAYMAAFRDLVAGRWPG
ncbi:MAG: glycosyltransferase family 1 protein [Acidobacteria bacterium]|nr:MAG: glycosyltransferase family 1 protein [Acidobacteriota bacterium]TDI40289.1 MAG: glycosyltransferase family 1 protein [Acidobacteriota bacterium]